MTSPDQKNVGDKTQRDGSDGKGTTGQTVAHAPGGPGWVSEHSGILWIVAVVLAISAIVVYMIIDN